uniref:Tudor domain containing 15 n=1 Tax=Takifugu rubripes TaxID=31033 RepID=A0A3B5JVE6_TAKRU
HAGSAKVGLMVANTDRRRYIFSSGSSALWSVDLKLTHLDWNPETTLIHFQGKHPTMCELDYIILQCEIQRAPKAKAAVDIGDLCLVEDLASAHWYRGRVQNRKEDLFDVFLIDYGNILSVGAANISACSDDLFSLHPKIVCGFLSSVLISQSCCTSAVEQYFSNLVGKNVTGYAQAVLPYKVLILEVPEINNELVLHGFGRHVDTDTFLFLVEMLTEIPPKQGTEPTPDPLIKNPSGREELSALQAYRDLLSFQGPQLRCGTQATVCVTAAASAQHFYCRICGMEQDLQEISKKLAAVYEGRTRETNHGVQENLGLLCAVKGKDWGWHRGFLPFLPDKSRIRVFFIDYGFFECVDIEDVHRLPDGFDSIPFMAFPCSLGDVDEEVKARQLSFLKSGLLGSVLDVEIRDFEEKEHLYTVTINNPEGKAVEKAEPILKTKRDFAAEDLTSHNSYLYLETIIRETFLKTLGIEEMTEGKNRVGESPASPSGPDEEKHVCSAFKSLNIKPGCQLAVCCSCVASPSDFWCLSFDRARALAKLMTKMQLYYSTHTVPLLPEDSCCVVKSPRDEVWYRAAITDRQQARCVLALVDYGYSVQMEEHHLQGILPEFLHLERQAFRCSLSRLIEPAEPVSVGGWSSKVCKLLKELLHDKNSLRCIVVSQWNIKNRGSCNVVELYSNKYQQSITSFLLEQGLAREATFSILPMSSEFPESFVYSSFDLGPGSKEEVFVTHIINQGEIYCHLERNIDVIEKLEMKIVEETRKRTPGDSDAAVRNLCLAKYFDGLWYRGFVHAVQSAVHLGVFFVDYGNSVISEKSNVARISGGCADLLHTPMQALRFRLASVPREELYADVSQWLSETVLHRQLTARVLAPMEDGSFDVELFDGDASINEKVRELVASLLPKTKPLLSLPGQNKTNLGPLSTGTTSQTQRGGGVCAMERPEEERSVPAEPQETPEEPQASLHAGGESVPELVGKTDIPQLSSLPDIEVTEGFRTSCFMSHIDSLSSFFLQRADDEPAILKMVEDLNSDALRGSLRRVSPTSLQTGALVLAEYEEDGALYRSVVKHLEGNSVKVEFLDYGNSSVMEDRIFSIPEEFLSQPRFSIPCCLFDNKAYENEAAFTRAAMEKPLLFHFARHPGPQWEVVIVEGATGPSEPPVESKTHSEERGNDPAGLSGTDQSYHGFAAAATNPFEFCVLLEESLLVLKKVSVMLSNLPKQLLPLPEAHLLPGTCCLLKSSTKKKWCRAEVVHLGGTIVLLNLLDYGFYECTPRENAGQLRMLPAEMRNLPKVIHPCILRGVRPLGADGQWADEAAFCFQRCLYQKRLQIFFRERVSDSAWKVDMLADGVHVAKWLVDAQQAHYLDIVQEVR